MIPLLFSVVHTKPATLTVLVAAVGFLYFTMQLGLLVLTRHRDESIIIGDDIVITVVDIRGDKVRLGIAAPIEISVHRQEVYDAILREGGDPTSSKAFKKKMGPGMLVLSRHRDESIVIGDDIVITVVDIRGDKVRLGIAAPIEISVHRREVYDAIQRENRRASRLDPHDAQVKRRLEENPPRNWSTGWGDPA